MFPDYTICKSIEEFLLQLQILYPSITINSLVLMLQHEDVQRSDLVSGPLHGCCHPNETYNRADESCV